MKNIIIITLVFAVIGCRKPKTYDIQIIGHGYDYEVYNYAESNGNTHHELKNGEIYRWSRESSKEKDGTTSPLFQVKSVHCCPSGFNDSFSFDVLVNGSKYLYFEGGSHEFRIQMDL